MICCSNVALRWPTPVRLSMRGMCPLPVGVAVMSRQARSGSRSTFTATSCRGCRPRRFELSRASDAHVGSRGIKVIYFERERQRWRDELAKINEIKEGIVRVVGKFLHRLMWATPTKLAFILLPEDRLGCFTEWYVVGVLIASVGIYLVPYFWLALLSTYVSASTLIVMLHIVLLKRVFAIRSPERSLLLFIFNVAQIVFMFATWYRLGCYSETDALLKSVLTFATIATLKICHSLPWLKLRRAPCC